MLLGLAKGKVGDLVFYRDGGEQRTRTRVIPKNPRTPAQMAQRCKISNVSALYRAMASVLADSFTNRPSNQSGYNAFAASAIAKAPYLTKPMTAAGACLPQPCQLSKGILPSVELNVTTADGTSILGISLDSSLTSSSTVGAVSQALLEEYPLLQNGDRLTGVLVNFAADTEAEDDADVYRADVTISHFVIDTTSEELMSTQSFAIVEGNLCPERFAVDFNENRRLAGCIVSRIDENGALQTSTEYAKLSTLSQQLYDDYRTAAAKYDAIQSYSAGTTSALR